MRNGKAKWWLLAPVLAVVAVGGLGWLVMTLWNMVLVPAAHFGVINFWQGLGLFLLSRILFGGFRGGHWKGGHRGHQMKEKWAGMSDDERQKFREEWGRRCGRFSSKPTQTAETTSQE